MMYACKPHVYTSYVTCNQKPMKIRSGFSTGTSSYVCRSKKFSPAVSMVLKAPQPVICCPSPHSIALQYISVLIKTLRFPKTKL